jgi:hypothetical protein
MESNGVDRKRDIHSVATGTLTRSSCRRHAQVIESAKIRKLGCILDKKNGELFPSVNPGIENGVVGETKDQQAKSGESVTGKGMTGSRAEKGTRVTSMAQQ